MTHLPGVQRIAAFPWYPVIQIQTIVRTGSVSNT